MYTNKSAPIFWTKSGFDWPAFNLCAPNRASAHFLLLCVCTAARTYLTFASISVSDEISWLFAHLIDGRVWRARSIFRRQIHFIFIRRMDRSNKSRNALSSGAETRLLKLDYIHLIAISERILRQLSRWPGQVF